MGMVVSLAMARLLSGLAVFVQHPGREKPDLVHLLWVLSTLLMLVSFWWWEFALSQQRAWRFELYAFILFYATLNYLLCALLFPTDLAEYDGYRNYFESRRQWFFGLLALIYLVDLVDTRLKGADHFARFGTEYLVQTALFVSLCGAAAWVRQRRFQLLFAAGHLVYQVGWVLRRFDVAG